MGCCLAKQFLDRKIPGKDKMLLYFHIKSSQSNESNSFTFIDNDTHWVYLFYQIGPLCNTLSLRPDPFIHWTNLILGFSPNITHHLGNLKLSFIELINSTFRIHSNITHNRCNLITPSLFIKTFHTCVYL